jgi:hypothetical protein
MPLGSADGPACDQRDLPLPHVPVMAALRHPPCSRMAKIGAAFAVGGRVSGGPAPVSSNFLLRYLANELRRAPRNYDRA